MGAERALQSWPTPESYLDAVGSEGRDLQRRGYLNEIGFAQMQDAARELWMRATGRDG